MNMKKGYRLVLPQEKIKPDDWYANSSGNFWAEVGRSIGSTKEYSMKCNAVITKDLTKNLPK